MLLHGWPATVISRYGSSTMHIAMPAVRGNNWPEIPVDCSVGVCSLRKASRFVGTPPVGHHVRCCRGAVDWAGPLPIELGVLGSGLFSALASLV